LNSLNPDALFDDQTTNSNNILNSVLETQIAYAAYTERQLNEVMATFWFNHFHASTKSTNILRQNITDRQAFEELRLLLNFQLNNRFLLTLILVGQPELNETLKKIPQFEQRIALKYHLSSLSYEEMVQYIHYRLKKAGLSRTVFTSEALELIFKYSEGIPRKINNLCDMGLLVGWSMKSEYVSEQIINNVLNEKKQW
jgi:hypothetical protein